MKRPCCTATLCFLLVLLISPVRVHAQYGRTVDLQGVVRGGPESTSCSVELNSLNTHLQVQQALCGPDGSFRFADVNRGSYRLVVRTDLRAYSEEIDLRSPREDVEINLPKPKESSEGSVSVAELRIPEKAKDELKKANEAMAKGELAKADQHAVRALEIAPRYARAMTVRAVLMSNNHDFESALKMLDQADSIDPMFPLTKVVRASVLNALGRPQEAEKAAEQGLRLDGSWQGHYELAHALTMQRHYEKALTEVNRAIATAPREFVGLALLHASVLSELHNVKGAREVLQALPKEQRESGPVVQLLATLDQQQH